MNKGTDSEVARAQHGWDVFTKFLTVSVLASAAVLGLMTLLLL